MHVHNYMHIGTCVFIIYAQHINIVYARKYIIAFISRYT